MSQPQKNNPIENITGLVQEDVCDKCGTDCKSDVCLSDKKEFCGHCKKEKTNGKCTNCGRPTKYQGDEIMCAKVDEYLSTCVDVPYTLIKSESNTGNSVENKLKVKLPTIEGFSLMLDISVETINQWEKESKKFSEALDKIRKEQKERLINKGISGDYNSTIAKLVLSANHGMAEKTESQIKGTMSIIELTKN